MGKDKITELAKRLEPLLLKNAQGVVNNNPPLEGPGIDIVGFQVGLGGDTILLYHANGSPISEYPLTAVGLAAGLAAAASGDVVYVPAANITGDATVPANVSLVGLDIKRTMITGTVTLNGDGAAVANLTITGADTGVIGPGSGTGYIYYCDVAGNEYSAESNGGNLVVIGGRASGGTARYGGTSTVTTQFYSSTEDAKALSLWNGSGNDAPPAGWEEPAFDDSGWSAAVEADQFGGFDIVGSERLWETQTPTSASERCLIRQSFTLAAGFTGATINLKSDDKCDVYINGEFLVSDSTFGSSNLVTANIDLDILVEGENVIAINGINEAMDYAWVGWRIDVSIPSIEVHAVEGSPTIGVEIALPGDRAAYDALNYPNLHTNDTDTEDGIHHTLGTGETQAAPGNHTHTDLEIERIVDIEYSIEDISNPPTEAELISVLGSPDTSQLNKIYHLNDGNNGTHEYLIKADGTSWWVTTLAKTKPATPAVNVDSTTILATGTGRWFGRASMKKRDDDVIVLVYREGSEHSSNDDEIHIRFSDDYGATWSDEDEDLNGDSVDVGYPTGADVGDAFGISEPWLYLASNGDLILQTWKRDVNGGVYDAVDGTWQTISSDGGLNWSPWNQVDFIGIGDDDDIFATDDDFVYNDVIYAAARIVDDYTTNLNWKNIFIKSEDNGITWEYVSDLSSFANNTIEAGLEYLGNSTIIAILRGFDNATTRKTISTDMGATWGAFDEIDGDIGIVGRPRIYTRSHVKGHADWWHDKVLIIIGFETMTPGSWLTRRNALWISQDGGTSWEGAFYLDSEVDDAGYGDIIYDPDNDVYRFISYQGNTNDADLKQYNLTITGI
jgi:hypothetical protein